MKTLHSLFMLFAGAFVGLLIAGYILPEQEANDAPEALHLTRATLLERTAQAEIEAEYPQLGIPDIDARIQRVVEEEIASFKSGAASLELPDSFSNTFSLNYSEVYLDEDLVSVVLSVYVYSGGAHGLEYPVTLNFFRKTGEPLLLKEALALTGKSLEEVSLQAKTVLSKRLGDEAFFEQGAEAETENFDLFSITKDAVIFYFPEYQVAAYAAGGQTLEVSRVEVDNQ